MQFGRLTSLRYESEEVGIRRISEARANTNRDSFASIRRRILRCIRWT
jgi:hypothetical protein